MKYVSNRNADVNASERVGERPRTRSVEVRARNQADLEGWKSGKIGTDPQSDERGRSRQRDAIRALIKSIG